MIDTAQIRGVSVFDLDGTLTHRDTFRAFLAYCFIRRPSRWPVILQLALYWSKFTLGTKDNGWLKSRFLLAILGHMPEPSVKDLTRAYLSQLRQRGIRKDGLQELQRRRQAGDVLILATASPDLYVQQLGDELGFDYVIATRVGWTTEKLLSGDLLGGNCRGTEKRERVERLLISKELNGPVRVYSDHHADLPILEWADQAFAVCPTRKLRKAAEALNAKIEHWH